jgi:hypothetical protein
MLVLTDSPLALQAIINNGPPVPCELAVNRHQPTAYVGPGPSKTWTHVDAHGHFHAWSTDPHDQYPTLEKFKLHLPCEGGCCLNDLPCEGYTVTRYRCVLCKEQIEPGVSDWAKHVTVGSPLTEWSVTVPILLDQGTHVSVRVMMSGAAGEYPAEMFGVALVANTQSTRHPDGPVVFRSELLGAGGLGHRDNPRPAPQPDSVGSAPCHP